MPANFDTEFSKWLTQHGNERAVAVNVLEFSHPAWGPGGGVPGSIWVCDYGEDFTATTEAPPRDFTALPLGFVCELTSDNVSTEQTVTLRVDNVNGLVAQQIRALNYDDLQKPVEIIYRAYLDIDRAAPAIDPLNLFVVNVAMSRTVVEIEGNADVLPNIQAGTRYTLDGFPSLAYL
jgi:Domain of unknown function (DUF1833)